jgi:hypothetical protein
MNLRINIPVHFNTLEVSDLTKEELISELYDYWLAGVELIECTTDLPKSIIDLVMFDERLVTYCRGCNLKPTQATEEIVRLILGRCISDEWDVLNELINNHDEVFAGACIEYANGGSLEDAEQSYIGQYDSDRDFVETVFADVLFEMPKHLQMYFDWDSYTSDVMHDYTEINGYYFNA